MLTSVATGQSHLIFPRLSSEEGTLTGVAVLNPNGASAVVTFTAYDGDGQTIEANAVENPRQITIEPGRQFADVTSSLFGTLPSGTEGWFEATSPSPGLTGFFLYLDFPAFTFFDGADLPVSDIHLVFPEVRLSAGFSTEINLVNSGTSPATVQLTLQGGETSVRANELTIPARGALRLDVTEAFEDNEPTGKGALPDPAIVSVVSTQPVAGFAFVRHGGEDLLGLNAVATDEQLNHLYFPQLAVGEIIRSELSLDNLSGRDTLVTLTAHQENGELFPPGVVSTNPANLALEAGQAVRLDLADTFGFVGGEVRQGWLEVAATTEALHGALSYSLPGTGSLAAVATNRRGSREAVFSHLATTSGFFTGLALLNSASLATNVRIVAISQAGEILGSETLTMAPGERISKLLGVDLIPQAAGQSGGAVYLRSSVPVFLTSLFGRLEGSGVLANIPAQPVPSAYRPDLALPQVRVDPPLASVEPGGGLSFMLRAEEEGVPVWKVNGMAGGSAQVGTIDPSGNFRAPTESPPRLPVSITAEFEDQAASASVDVISRQVLVSGLGVVQSVAYLEGLSRLYVVETGEAAASIEAPQGTASVIVDVTGGNRAAVRAIPGEDVSKILAYRRANGTESLLVAGRGTGQIYRLEVEEPFELTVIASGLNAPGALALDPTSGDLLVAEADRLSRIEAEKLQGDGSDSQPGTLLLGDIAPRGVALDSCTGDILFSDADGQSIKKLDRHTAEVTTVVGLTNPTQLLGIIRSGVSCPDGFHLFVVEPSEELLSRVVPEQGLASPFVSAPQLQDLAFLPAGNPAGSEGVLVAGQAVGGGQVEQLALPQLYLTNPINPPDLPTCAVVAEIADPYLEAAIKKTVGLGPAEPITCDLAERLAVIAGQDSGITRLDGLEAFANLRTLFLDNNQISDITPLDGLTKLQDLRLERNQIDDISPLTGLTDLQSLTLGSNQISDISSLAGLTNLQILLLEDNQVSDISPLTGLSNLENLSLGSAAFLLSGGGNQISDISPLAGLTNLENLTVGYNQLSDVGPLAGLTNLQYLGLNNNEISDISALAGLTNLQFLVLRINQISDVSPLSGLANVPFLDLRFNQISDISPLTGLTNVQTLSLDGNPIDDISPLAGLTNLQGLSLEHVGSESNLISDTSLLAGLRNLQSLSLGSNQIRDISPLAGLTNLRFLSLWFNQISDISPLTGLTNLGTLNLQSNRIEDISSLVANMGLGAGDYINIADNPLDAGDCGDITTLIGRGATVQISLGLCPQ